VSIKSKEEEEDVDKGGVTTSIYKDQERLLTLDPGSGCSTTSRRDCLTPNIFTLMTSKM